MQPNNLPAASVGAGGKKLISPQATTITIDNFISLGLIMVLRHDDIVYVGQDWSSLWKKYKDDSEIVLIN